MTPKWMHHRGATPAKRAAPAARAESAAAAPKPPQPKASVLEGFVYGSNWTPLVAGFSLLAVLALATFFKIRLPRDLLPDLNLALFGIACSGLAVFCGGFVGCLRRVLFTGALVDAMRQTVVISAMIFVTLLGCAVFVLVFRGFNGDVLIARLLANVPGGPNGALLAVIGSMLVFGLLMDFLGILLILVPISAPIILQMDINPIWFGVMIAITLQTNFLTPPFGFAYSRLRAVEPAWKGAAGARRGILPFLVIQLIGLALIAIFPDLATLLPTLLQN
jgi:TRAP-type mannitol/chloroaromatic compound transport system permease large subunit